MILHEFEGVNIVNVLYAEDQHGPTENLHPVVFIGTLLSSFRLFAPLLSTSATLTTQLCVF